MVKIVVLASFNMDLVMRTERRPESGETLQGEFAMYLGGKGFNQAIAARRLGADVSVIGRVGDDEFGRRFLEALDREGIEHSCVSVDPDAGTGVASIVVDPSGENAIVQAPQANLRLRYDEVLAVDAVEADGRYVPSALSHADMLLATLETPLDVAMRLAEDMSFLGKGEHCMLNLAPATRIDREAFRGNWGTVTANALEAETFTGIPCSGFAGKFKAATSLSHMCGAKESVITLGIDGAYFERPGTPSEIPAFKVDAIDTVGAGDAFCAALAVAAAEGVDLADAVRFANAAGALATTKAGAEPSMPYRADVETLLARGETR